MIAVTHQHRRGNFVHKFASAALWVALVMWAHGAHAADGSPQRIVSLSPHATELLFSAGLGSRIVGATEACDFPAEAKSIPHIASYRGANIEAILALKPDIVVAWPSGNRADDLAALSRLGIRVHRSELTTLESIIVEFKEFRRWAGAANAPSEEAMRAANIVNTLAARYATARRIRVFYQLGEGRLFTLSNQHLIGEALSLCGADNVFGAVSIPAPEVSREAVLAANPEAILVADAAAFNAIKKSWNPGSGSTGRFQIAVVDGARLHRPTLRTFDAVTGLCETINQIRQTATTAPASR
jgi:ABC-type Fe3+-hydroxamate transport system substrate-binding protein